jgi:hypothetical protein
MDGVMEVITGRERRRQAREEMLVAPETPVFMPVKMFETPLPATATTHPASSPPPARPASDLIEIDLGNGRQMQWRAM